MTEANNKDSQARETSTRKRSLDSAFLAFAFAYLLINIPTGILGSMKTDIATGLNISLHDFMNILAISDYIFAASLIPAGLLINRFSPGSIAWISILVIAIGLAVRGIASNSLVFLAGSAITNVGWALAIPLVGQIARNRLDTKTFITATTTVLVLGQGIEAFSLMILNVMEHSISWRTLYLCTFLIVFPSTFLVWRYVKPSHDFKSGSIKTTLRTLWTLMRSPVLWLSSLASALFLATLMDFGFIWDFNFQTAIGWSRDYSISLAFLFLIGIIIGGSGASVVARWIGEYATMLIGLSYGCITFGLVMLITPERSNIWFVAPLLFTMGMGLGSGSMILPYYAHFFEEQASGIYFAFGQTVNALLVGFLIAVPLLEGKDASNWSPNDSLDAMAPYVWTFFTGMALYIVLGALHKLIRRYSSQVPNAP